jgi:nucleoid DNA-binding protein
MNRFKKEQDIINEISKELDLDKRTVMMIVKIFFKTVRKQLSLNKEINIKGFFTLTLANHYKKQLIKYGDNYNPRKRIPYVVKKKNKWLKKEQH